MNTVSFNLSKNNNNLGFKSSFNPTTGVIATAVAAPLLIQPASALAQNIETEQNPQQCNPTTLSDLRFRTDQSYGRSAGNNGVVDSYDELTSALSSSLQGAEIRRDARVVPLFEMLDTNLETDSTPGQISKDELFAGNLYFRGNQVSGTGELTVDPALSFERLQTLHILEDREGRRVFPVPVIEDQIPGYNEFAEQVQGIVEETEPCALANYR